MPDAACLRGRCRWIRRVVLTLALGGTASCGGDPSAPHAEHQVWESFFDWAAREAGPPIRVVSVGEVHWFGENTVASVVRALRLPRNATPVPGPLIEALFRVNETARPLGWRPSGTGVMLLPPEYAKDPHVDDPALCLVRDEADGIGVRLEGRGYYRDYWSVSRVAFGAAGRTALVKYSRHCAPMSGGGEGLLLLEFRAGRWRVTGGRVLWIT